MVAKPVKTFLVYALTLAVSLGVGLSLPTIKQWFTPAYTEGNFSAYYPDAKTNVVVYGTPTCPFCTQVRTYLKDQKIAFVDHDLATSAKGMAEFHRLGGDRVPMILVGGRQLTGFNKAELDAALAKAGHPGKG